MFLKTFYSLIFLLFGNADSLSNTALETLTSWNCLPNRMFTYDHNICYCDGKGEKITCKRKMYSTLYPELQASHLQSIKKNLTMDCSKKITSTNIFHNGCYECLCTDEKHATCIPSKCKATDSKLINSVEKCIPGSIFSDKCNGCICGPDGTATCTNLDCYALHDITKTKDVLCIPNSTLIVECNECSCNQLGTSVSCEKTACNYPNFRHKHILNVTTVCTPKNIFNYDACRKCICSTTGTYAMCSGVKCDMNTEDNSANKDTVEKCHPGIIFNDDCNICICNNHGKGICTTLSCDLKYRFKYVEQLNYSVP
ncbi:laminin-like protein epi-1 [Copidosoma floridanum]|uniref:laminin-like protein epi-1 n=1 Tax=Copidosoma floridanum TaxID=29053 RepID=UPI000C6F9872|nr:laminin-like protein epi-1 [Copidosoma floridanum]